MKRAQKLGVLSNVLFLLLYAAVLPYPWLFGLVMITGIDAVDSIADVLFIIIIVLLLCAPILGVIGIILSVRYRKRERYMEAIAIQLLPISAVMIAAFVFIFVWLFGGLFTGT